MLQEQATPHIERKLLSSMRHARIADVGKDVTNVDHLKRG